MSVLNKQLNLPPGALAKFHDDPSRSCANVRFTKSTPLDQPDNSDDPSHFNAHTDHGSVTLVFHDVLGGLQVFQPEPVNINGNGSTNGNLNGNLNGESDASNCPRKDDENDDNQSQSHHSTRKMRWVYAKPLPGHAIVNMGSALKVFSNGQLRNAIHRVVEAPGIQRECVRYSLVYLSSPKEDVLMKSLIKEDSENGNGNERDVYQTYADFCTKRMEKPKDGWNKNSGVYGLDEVLMVSSA